MTADTLETIVAEMREFIDGDALVELDTLAAWADRLAALRQQQGQEWVRVPREVATVDVKHPQYEAGFKAGMRFEAKHRFFPDDGTTPAEARGVGDGVTDAMVQAALDAQSAYGDANLEDCPRCKGQGWHHGFGEDGADPDWCSECGGPGHIWNGTPEGEMRASLEAALASNKPAGWDAVSSIDYAQQVGYTRQAQAQGSEGQAVPCEFCGGRGFTDDGHVEWDGQVVSAPEGCVECDGRGTVPAAHAQAGEGSNG